MIDVISPMIKKFLPFAQERMGFEDPPKLFLKGSEANAADPLGKTAYYDPKGKSITVFITGRHPKDVMRSISHELVHHAQNCRGEFTDVGEMAEDYAQNNKHLREMERQAYEIGNLCFRDWSDSIKNTTYFEQLNKGDDNLMSIKTWKNKEINTLLTESWGLKMDLEALSEESNTASEEINKSTGGIKEKNESTNYYTGESDDTGDTEGRGFDVMDAQHAQIEHYWEFNEAVAHAKSIQGLVVASDEKGQILWSGDNEEKSAITVEQIREVAMRAITKLKETKKNG